MKQLQAAPCQATPSLNFLSHSNNKKIKLVDATWMRRLIKTRPFSWPSSSSAQMGVRGRSSSMQTLELRCIWLDRSWMYETVLRGPLHYRMGTEPVGTQPSAQNTWFLSFPSQLSAWGDCSLENHPLTVALKYEQAFSEKTITVHREHMYLFIFH